MRASVVEVRSCPTRPGACAVVPETSGPCSRTVLEQGPLVSGTTAHAPGLVGQLRTSTTLARMLLYSVSLYRQLKLNGESGYLGEGSLRLASSKDRWQQIQVL